jgi:hypothetical protein
MKSMQGWGWLTAGVLALGLNGLYQDGGAAWAHRMAGRAVGRIEARLQPAVALAMGRADWFVAKTQSMATQAGMAQNEPASCRIEAAMARVQSKLVRSQMRFANIEQMSARQEAALARVEANRARIEAQVARVRLAPVAFYPVTIPVVACPRVRVNVPQVNVPRLPGLKIPAPAADVE